MIELNIKNKITYEEYKAHKQEIFNILYDYWQTAIETKAYESAMELEELSLKNVLSLEKILGRKLT